MKLFLGMMFLALPLLAQEKMAYMYENGKGEKSLFLQDENTTTKIDTGFPFSIYPYLSKDASELAFVAGSDEKNLNIYIKSLKTGEQQKFTTKDGFVLHPHISSNKKYLSYSQLDSGKNHIIIVDRDTSTSRKISSEDSLYFPKISSYGSFIVYQKTISYQKKQVWLESLTSQETASLLSSGFDKCMSPSLNFDDSEVVMTCFKDDVWNIYKVNLQSKNISQLTFTDFETFAPTFDRKNNIIFASNEKGSFALYKLTKNSQNNSYARPVEIARMDGDLYAPSLSGNLSYQTYLPTLIPGPARSSFGAMELNQKLYLFGGHQGQEHTYPPESFLDRLDIYDMKTKTWKLGKARPVTAHGYNVEACGSNIYAFGGFTYSADHKPKWKSIKNIDRYNTATDEWESIGELKHARSSNVVAKVGEKIYLIGGWDSTPKFENDYDGTFHRSIEVFDCATESLSPETFELPDPLRRALTGLVRDGKILLIGGIGVGATHFDLLNNVTEFDPQTKKFKDLAPIPFATFAPAAGLVNNEIHVFGGMFKLGDYSYEYVNHVYAMDNGEWSHTGRYLTEAKGFSMVLNIGDEVWVLGGHSYESAVDAPVSTIEVWH